MVGPVNTLATPENVASHPTRISQHVHPAMSSSEEAPTAVAANEPSPNVDDIREVAVKAEGDPTAGDSTRTSEEDPSGEAREPRKHKRRSGNSVDLTYRYHDPSEDELSWTEDEHGNRRRRKSRKRKSGGGDDFKNGIVYISQRNVG